MKGYTVTNRRYKMYLSKTASNIKNRGYETSELF